MKRPCVLLADGHAIVIEGLRRLLEPHFEIVGSVGDGRALVAAVEALRPDVIVVAISMPLLNGIDAIRQIRRTNRRVKVVFLTAHSEMTYVSEALRVGEAYVLKSSPVAEILLSIRQVLAGGRYVTPLIDMALLQRAMERGRKPEESPVKLTARQREILQLVAEGRTGKEMAAILHLSPRTVEFHKYRLMKALGLSTTANLVQYAVKRGIVSG